MKRCLGINAVLLASGLLMMLLLTGCVGYGGGDKVTIAGEKVSLNVTSLNLRRAELSPDDLDNLALLQNLELTAETATDISPLLALKNLEYLTLWGDEKNLEVLAGLVNLKSLILYTREDVDYEMLDALQTAIPGLHIELEGHWGV